jgi:hypothetical protein
MVQPQRVQEPRAHDVFVRLAGNPLNDVPGERDSRVVVGEHLAGRG